MRSNTLAALAVASLAGLSLAACAQQGSTQVERGKYLAQIMGCSDCHTPGGLGPKPDTARFLGGSDADFVLPGMGVFAPPNLTPDRATGIGSWTVDQIAAAFTTGVRPDGRVLAPAMPWVDFAHLSKADAMDIALYLKTLPAVSHKVPDPRASRPCVDKAVECVVQRE
jgi:mono/diheme cytochrome c family protein